MKPEHAMVHRPESDKPLGMFKSILFALGLFVVIMIWCALFLLVTKDLPIDGEGSRPYSDTRQRDKPFEVFLKNEYKKKESEKR